MKKVHIVGKDLEKISRLKEELESRGLIYTEENPDLVISYGGDGMFLISERMFPGVLKFMMKDSEIGNKCFNVSLSELLDKYCSGKYKIEKIRKLKGVRRGRFEWRELIGVNDVVIRNSLPTEALRFKVFVNGDEIGSYIGDGIIVSTAYGSGGYFHSITGKEFNSGIGLAFNNTSKKMKPLFLSMDDKIEVEILRGNGVLVADNNRDYVGLEDGERVSICVIEDFAQRIILDKR